VGWTVRQISELFKQLPVGKRFDKKMTVAAGRVPVIDQSRSSVIGFHNELPGIQASAVSPIVTFANHTCEMRLMRESFSVIQNVFPLRPTELCESAVALYYLTKGRIFLEEYKGHFPTFRSCYICLPPLAEQRAIAATLGALDDKIELNRKMNATLEAMARALFRDWFVDFGPTRAKMEGREPYLAPELWSLFPDRLDNEGKPEGCEDKPLTEFFSIIGGGTPKTSISAFWGGPIPWFSVTDTPPNGSVFVTDTEKTITEAGVNGSSARLVSKGTTIISARGTVGKLDIAGRDINFNQSCYGLRALGSVGDYATYLIAQNMVIQLQAMAHGSVFSTITRQTFESLSLPMPSEGVLRAFENAVSPMFDKILANVHGSRTLAQTRDLLLPRMMSGELRVAEAERLVGEVA
jgi:type I restriction enzyme S subunit